jgi:hypothetical protein
MFANRKNSTLLLVGLLVLQMAGAARYALCELQLKALKEKKEGKNLVDVTVRSYLLYDSSDKDESESHLKKLMELINDTEKYNEKLKEFKSSLPEEQKGIIDVNNFRLRAFNGEDQKLVENLFTYDDSSPGFEFSYDNNGKMKVDKLEKRWWRFNSGTKMLISERNGFPLILFIKKLIEYNVKPILYRINFETLEKFDKQYGEENGNELFMSSRDRLQMNDNNEFYLVFTKKEFFHYDPIEVQINKEGEFKFDNGIGNPKEATIQTDPSEKFVYCFDSLNFFQYFEFSKLISNSISSTTGSNPNCLEIAAGHKFQKNEIKNTKDGKNKIHDLEVLFRKKHHYNVTILSKNNIMISLSNNSYAPKSFNIKKTTFLGDIALATSFLELQNQFGAYIPKEKDNKDQPIPSPFNKKTVDLIDARFKFVRKATEVLLSGDFYFKNLSSWWDSDLIKFFTALRDTKLRECINKSVNEESLREEQYTLVDNFLVRLLLTLDPAFSVVIKDHPKSKESINDEVTLDERLNAMGNYIDDLSTEPNSNMTELKNIIDRFPANEKEEKGDTYSDKMSCADFKEIFLSVFENKKNTSKKCGSVCEKWRENLVTYLDERHRAMSEPEINKILSQTNYVSLIDFAHSFLNLKERNSEESKKSTDIERMITFSLLRQIETTKQPEMRFDPEYSDFKTLREQVISITEEGSKLYYSPKDIQVYLNVFLYVRKNEELYKKNHFALIYDR